ncbi:cytochrome P450 [Bacillus tamaricis]|uniref:Cytochrome P450 n=2 Tax=Evansella tamaricis TaxID=2069301 RepID=A0ABS6JJT2_9BACI|nr:cytochrome P450 [Evansella tamaricis]
MKKTEKLGPKGNLISGHLKDFQRDPLQFMQKLAEDYGEIARFKFGPFQDVYLISNPELIKQVLVTKQKNFVKSRDLTILKPIIGEGLLTSEKGHHLKQRRLIQPHFKREHIRSYGEDMIKTTEEYMKSWKEKEERVLSKDMMNITLGIISKTMFNMNLEEGYDVIGPPIETVMKLAVKRMRSLAQLPLWIPTKTNRNYKRAIDELDHVLFSIIENRRSHKGKSEDLLGVLMDAKDDSNGEVMSNQQLRDELMTIFLAGHETTANALSWTFYLLAQHPEVEKKLHREIDSVIGSNPLSPNHYKELTYAQNIISEALRLYPPAYVIGRQVDKTVNIGGIQLNKGDMTLISQYVMHRRREYFDQPDNFIPERFENQFTDTLPPYTYFPFGGGPRVCIGNHFALMEAVLVLVCIARHFKIKLTPSNQTIKAQPLITLRPKGGINVILEKRS